MTRLRESQEFPKPLKSKKISREQELEKEIERMSWLNKDRMSP